MQAATDIPRRDAEVARASLTGPGVGRRSLSVRGGLAALGLAGVVVAAAVLAATAAAHPGIYVPASVHGGFPSWLSGPWHGLSLGHLTGGRFQTLILVMCASYALALLGGRTLSLRAVATAVVAAHVALLLGPVLLSQDVFGYVSFARLGALHSLDPYTHVSADFPTDAVFPYLGWRKVHSPYGPLFTLGSYALAPLGVAGTLWALKAIAMASSLATVGLVAHAAQRVGRSPAGACAFVGLNPVLLVFAVGGAHNDTLLVALLAAALALAAGAKWGRSASALVVATAIKVSAGLVLAFLILGPSGRRERMRTLMAAACCALVVAAVAAIGLGPHALGFTNALQGQQQMVATHSLPNETARLVGLPSVRGLPAWWRHAYLGAFLAVLAVGLWRTARGADWRVAAGWATVALLLSTAWLLPWYAIWVLPLAAVVEDRRLKAAALAICTYAVLIRLPVAASLLGGRRS